MKSQVVITNLVLKYFPDMVERRHKAIAKKMGIESCYHWMFEDNVLTVSDSPFELQS